MNLLFVDKWLQGWNRTGSRILHAIVGSYVMALFCWTEMHIEMIETLGYDTYPLAVSSLNELTSAEVNVQGFFMFPGLYYPLETQCRYTLLLCDIWLVDTTTSPRVRLDSERQYACGQLPSDQRDERRVAFYIMLMLRKFACLGCRNFRYWQLNIDVRLTAYAELLLEEFALPSIFAVLTII